MPNVVHSILIALTVFASTTAVAQWAPDTDDELQVAAAETLERFRAHVGEEFDALLNEAHAYAVFPAVRRASALAGWASGKGVLIEQDRYTGHARQRRFSLGFQFGYQKQGQILLFRDETAVLEFKEGRINFTPQASYHATKPRKAAETSYSPRVEVLSISESGLSVEAAIGGSKYKCWPATSPSQL